MAKFDDQIKAQLTSTDDLARKTGKLWEMSDMVNVLEDWEAVDAENHRVI